MTPEQMRALADDAEKLQGDSDYDYVFVTDVMTALRAAADQLEAVRAELFGVLSSTEDMPANAYRRLYELHAILTADIAPHSDRIEDVMQRNWNRRYGADTAPQEDRDE
ncbi:hypothetical protein [Curtobacterium sp. Arg-1]|uniref:hypothetical protein n=1 Tax=Curtobacterium sp. Arg-1 TaxID=2935040 RepID=UPI0021D7EED3|nr:hypothetical protein [Curtobacterium sp. Arg-1]UXZ57073.1 hypothetical protein MXD64_13845 [Curtobacterium sp. Arg-1]